jgi:Crp-like helix-turn-helix domain
MTHEFFAQMLGTGRPSVSLAAAVLQRAGFIQYARGTVKIIDRKGLEVAACECYAVIQKFDGSLYILEPSFLTGVRIPGFRPENIPLPIPLGLDVRYRTVRRMSADYTSRRW